MNSASLLAECDVLIVGAGIVGLAHATEALRRGLTVIVIDRDSRAVGASVRNFGHCCVTAQSADLLELALLARERWLYYGERAGFFHVESGALAVARSAEELAVLDELSASRETGQVRLVTASDVHERLGRAEPNGAVQGRQTRPESMPGGSIVGGAVLRDDIRVDPRQAVGSLAGWFVEQAGAQMFWRTSFFGHDGVLAHTSRGSIRAQQTIVCVGHDLDYVLPDVAERFAVQRCWLQMALIEAPDARRIAPAVLTGTSMLRYPAFVQTHAATALRAAIAQSDPDLIDIGANVMFTQRPDGSIIAGDSHAYGDTAEPFLVEDSTDTLLRHVRQVLGVTEARVVQRWQGICASSSQQSYLIEHVDDAITAVSVTSGVGMTIGFGVAQRTFDSFG